MIHWTLPDAHTLATFVPSWLQVGGLFAVLASGLVMLVLGRAVLGPRTMPEVALMAGWGLISLVLTLWGVLTPNDMRIPAVAMIAVAAVTALLPRGRLTTTDLVALGRLLALAIPLLAVFASAMPSQRRKIHSMTRALSPNPGQRNDPSSPRRNQFTENSRGRFSGATRSPMSSQWAK